MFIFRKYHWGRAVCTCLGSQVGMFACSLTDEETCVGVCVCSELDLVDRNDVVSARART